MPQEIERKFLLRSLPQQVLGSAAPVRIRQGYLVLEGEVELRIRHSEDDYYISSKHGSGLVREEDGRQIDKDLFEFLWPFTEKRRVEKDRYTVSNNGFTLEFDYYVGSLAGLVVLEVEFASVADADAFTMPDYCLQDITNDRRYKNAILAEQGRP